LAGSGLAWQEGLTGGKEPAVSDLSVKSRSEIPWAWRLCQPLGGSVERCSAMKEPGSIGRAVVSG